MCVVSNSLQPPWTVARQAPRSGGLFQAGMLEWVAIAFSSFFPSSVLFATLREAGYLEGVALFQRLLKIFFVFLLAEFTVLCLLHLFIVAVLCVHLLSVGFPLGAVTGGDPLVGVHGFLAEGVSLRVEQELWGVWASTVVARVLT